MDGRGAGHGNGLAGVTLHDHAPGQYMNGNQIVGNSFDANDTTGGHPRMRM